MRTLIILRGAPGCGKSTWIKDNELEHFTLCPDEIRLLCSSLEQSADGNYAVAHNSETENTTWKILFQLLEYRMSRGEFTIIDGTASKTKDIQKYKDLADQYRYRMYCVDFSDVPLELCLTRNKLRPVWKWVPEEAIKNIYARFATQKVPAGVTVLKPNELYKVLEQPIDLSEYKKVVFIGDIHGCYTTLMKYFANGIDPEVAYIFLGDFIDRGNENVETLKFLYSIMDKKNVCLLEGNHERWIRDYGNSAPSKSREFETKTRPQLISGGFTEKEARMLYRKVRQMSHFTYNGLEILACHGGIPNMANNLVLTPARDFIHGTGDYKDYKTVAETWMGSTAENAYLVHGHRNVEKDEVRIADRVFNLEGGVEFGGQLRIVELENAGRYPEYGVTETGDRIPVGFNTMCKWNIIEIDDCQPITEELCTEQRPVETVEDAIAYLRNNKQVQEKPLGNGISSFNFTRDAFMKGNWNRQTILARGLFIDTDNNQIMARSYEKFFKINEVHETELFALKERLQFPVTAYVKENGFLGIVSYDYKKDDLFIATKSTDKGDYVEYFKELLAPFRDNIYTYLKTVYNTTSPALTLVFEVMDVENDPHIIKYPESKIVLLDAIKNDLTYKTLCYDMLSHIAEAVGCEVKERAFVLKDWEDFTELYRQAQEEDYQYNGEFIEGFVFEDASGFMTKCKTGYYNLWKKLRGVCDQTLRCGYITKTGMLSSSTENFFYGFCKELFIQHRDKETKSYPFKTDIISIRERFYNN